LKRGEIGIQGPGNPNAQGPDYITYDPNAHEIIIWDAKYRREGGSYPKSISDEKMRKWLPEVRDAINRYDGPHKNGIDSAFQKGNIAGRIFPYP
jgi:hypothetical protein